MNHKNDIVQLLACCLSVLLIWGCKYHFPHSSITVINEADHDVRFYIALGGEQGILYPDTVLKTSLRPPMPKARAGYSGYHDCDCSKEDFFAFVPSDTVSIYIFHPDTLDGFEWATVAEDYRLLQRYDLSFHDLESLDWKVYYPPNELMESVKSYP